jgi:hypothetical protein
VDAVNAMVHRYALQNNVPVIDAAAVASGGSDGEFHLIHAAYNAIAEVMMQRLCWPVSK